MKDSTQILSDQMLANWLVATTVDEVGVSFFDFYTIGHICMGVGFFLFFSLFYTIPMSKDDASQILLPLWAVWIITFLIGIAWEFIENIILLEMGLKFEHRADSLQNIITDVIFAGIGGLGSSLFCHLVFNKDKNMWAYYIFGIIGFGLWLGVFIILRYLTYQNTPVF